MTQDLSQLSMLERIAAQTKQAAPAPKPVAKPAPTSDWRIPEAQPVTIPRDVFAPHSPNRDVRLSGAQVIKTPGRMDQADGKTAHDLIGQRRIRREQTGYFTYYTFHCGEPCTVSIDGMWFEIVPHKPDISDE